MPPVATRFVPSVKGVEHGRLVMSVPTHALDLKLGHSHEHPHSH